MSSEKAFQIKVPVDHDVEVWSGTAGAGADGREDSGHFGIRTVPIWPGGHSAMSAYRDFDKDDHWKSVAYQRLTAIRIEDTSAWQRPNDTKHPLTVRGLTSIAVPNGSFYIAEAADRLTQIEQPGMRRFYIVVATRLAGTASATRLDCQDVIRTFEREMVRLRKENPSIPKVNTSSACSSTRDSHGG